MLQIVSQSFLPQRGLIKQLAVWWWSPFLPSYRPISPGNLFELKNVLGSTQLLGSRVSLQDHSGDCWLVELCLRLLPSLLRLRIAQDSENILCLFCLPSAWAGRTGLLEMTSGLHSEASWSAPEDTWALDRNQTESEECTSSSNQDLRRLSSWFLINLEDLT